VDYPNTASASDNIKIIVYVSNAKSASEAMYNPIIKVYSHDESNVRILGSNEKNWADRRIPANGRDYYCGEFEIQLSEEAPEGFYNIVVELRYNYGFFKILSDWRFVTFQIRNISEYTTRLYHL
jgi:hypothetical protein